MKSLRNLRVSPAQESRKDNLTGRIKFRNEPILRTVERRLKDAREDWNRAAVLARLDGDEDFLRELAELFIEGCPTLLSQLETAGEPPFDMIFIDADKEGYANYLRNSMPLLREGGIILADNTLPEAVLNPRAAESGIKRFNADVSAHPDLISILVPVLRTQGIDGLLIAMKQTSRSG